MAIKITTRENGLKTLTASEGHKIALDADEAIYTDEALLSKSLSALSDEELLSRFAEVTDEEAEKAIEEHDKSLETTREGTEHGDAD